MSNSFYEAFMEILKMRSTDKKELVNTLTEILNIEKEAVKRRLKGTVPFTFAEVTVISSHYSISLDNILAHGSDLSYSRVCRLSTINFLNPDENEYQILQGFLNDLQDMRDYPESEIGVITNAIPQILYVAYPTVYRFYLFKWFFQYSDTLQKTPLSEIFPPKRLCAINDNFRKEFKGAANIFIILDENIFRTIVKDLAYFHQINLITTVEIEQIHRELSAMLDEIERITINGYFDSGEKVKLYVSNIHIETEQSVYAIRPGYNISMCQWFMINDTIATDLVTYEQAKKQLVSLQRTSNLITESGEIQRVKFLRDQRQVLSHMLSKDPV